MKKLSYLAVIGASAARFAAPLEALFEKVIVLPPHHALAAPVASHPDMLLSQISDTLFTERNYAQENFGVFDEISRLTKLSVKPLDINLEARYPHDIAFNALNTGAFLYSLTEYTAPEIIEKAQSCSIIPHRVKQGYTACSALYAENTVITGDPSISNAAKADGFRVAKIDDSPIALAGYNRGFIGGAGGVCRDTIYLLGKSAQIEAALGSFKLVCLSDSPLEDFGGIKFFKLSEQP